MMTIAPAEALNETAQAAEDDLDHIVCCRDNDIAMCGVDLSTTPWLPPNPATTCLVCLDLDESDVPCAIACPLASAKR